MKKIYYASIEGPDYNRSMGEIMEAEHGEEWDGDVAAYIWNDFILHDGVTLLEGVPGDVQQNYGGMDGIENVTTLCFDGEEREIWFAADDD